MNYVKKYVMQITPIYNFSLITFSGKILGAKSI